MTDTSIIDTRRQEVSLEIDRHKEAITELEAELAELDTAARVIARLSGAAWSDPRPADPIQQAKATGGKPKAAPPMPAMITDVLHHHPNLEPKAVVVKIAELWWPDVPAPSVSSTMWRMAKRGDLINNEGRYSLPQKNEVADDDPAPDTSATSLFNLAEGREAGPGGGG